MTNKEDGVSSCLDGVSCCDRNPRIAALLAVHLVSQVLDEAYIIANTAQETGQPWRYLSMLNNFKISRLGDTDDEDVSFEPSQGDCDVNENKIEPVANIVATSTPQKLAARQIGYSGEGEVSNPFHDSSNIGQGDEDSESRQNELTNSTSMFINHLFDMSEVERIVICDETQIIQSNPEPNDLLNKAMNKIMASYVTNTLLPLDALPPAVDEGQVRAELSRSDNSDYSFLADAFAADISRDVAFYIDDDVPCQRDRDFERFHTTVVEEIDEPVDVISVETENENNEENNDVVLYENAYLTLNRDYDQCSDDDGFPVLQDPKGMTLQEVELMTANTSDEELSYPDLQSKQKCKEEAPVCGASGSHKNTLARRCRTQGARLLACLRGWWRRKTPGKRKESRYPGALAGLCPLSPDARRRASSLLDNRLLRSPSPHSNAWKFNTVNEAVVNSNHWKDYTFDVKPEDTGEY